MVVKKNIALSDSGFVFNPSTGDSFSANPIALEIIKLLKEGKNLTDVKVALRKRYMIDEETLDRDCDDFANVLSKFKLADANEKTED